MSCLVWEPHPVMHRGSHLKYITQVHYIQSTGSRSQTAPYRTHKNAQEPAWSPAYALTVNSTQWIHWAPSEVLTHLSLLSHQTGGQFQRIQKHLGLWEDQPINQTSSHFPNVPVPFYGTFGHRLQECQAPFSLPAPWSWLFLSNPTPEQFQIPSRTNKKIGLEWQHT